jgi:hypothetical protein
MLWIVLMALVSRTKPRLLFHLIQHGMNIYRSLELMLRRLLSMGWFHLFSPEAFFGLSSRVSMAHFLVVWLYVGGILAQFQRTVAEASSSIVEPLVVVDWSLPKVSPSLVVDW